MIDRPPRSPRFSDLGLRLGSGLALAAVALVDLWLGGLWVAGLVGLALVLMLWELDRMASGGGAPGLLLCCAAGAGVVAVLFTHFWGMQAGLLALLVGAVGCAALRRPASGWVAAGLVYFGIGMSFLVVMRQVEPHGLFLVFWLVVIVIAADVGAYFVGRSFGGPKLWRRVSPGKTWSGALGGLAFAAGASLVAGPLAGIRPGSALLLGLGVGIASQLGDLLESAVKRRFGVKDASRLIPGHGGVMDRLDGLLGGAWFLAGCTAVGLGVAG